MDQYLYKPNNVPVYQKLFQVSVVNLIQSYVAEVNVVLNSAHHSGGPQAYPMYHEKFLVSSLGKYRIVCDFD